MLRDASVPGKEVAYTVVMRGSNMGKAIRTDQWHYTLWPKGSEELYDLNADPHEDTNLANAATHAQTVKSMRQLLRKAESTATSRQR